jgi:hypothetical protein
MKHDEVVGRARLGRQVSVITGGPPESARLVELLFGRRKDFGYCRRGCGIVEQPNNQERGSQQEQSQGQ